MIKCVFSGIQPTGNIHIGNYLSAIRNWVELQGAFDCIFCIVDLHAITIHQDPLVLRSKIRELACLLLASGIDPSMSALFVQSHISAHAELAWIINCLTPMGQLQRMTQFKEKSDKHKEMVSAGLFTYPALMAADILLYKTDMVPVGEDQKQHLEFIRDSAQRFNARYGDTFKLPEPVIPKSGARIMGLDDPSRKMSKSEMRLGHALNLLDSPAEIRTKIMRATTDSLHEIHFDEKRLGINNLLVIYELFTGYARTAIEARFAGKGYAAFKQELAEVIIEVLKPIQHRYLKLTKDSDYIDSVIAEASSKVRPIAENTLNSVKNKMGLV